MLSNILTERKVQHMLELQLDSSQSSALQNPSIRWNIFIKIWPKTLNRISMRMVHKNPHSLQMPYMCVHSWMEHYKCYIPAVLALIQTIQHICQTSGLLFMHSSKILVCFVLTQILFRGAPQVGKKSNNFVPHFMLQVHCASASPALFCNI